MLRVSSHGLKAPGGGNPGDLYVQIVFEPLPHIRREGEDAYTETSVPLGIALLGGEVTIPTIDAHATLKIPPGTQPRPSSGSGGTGFPATGVRPGRPYRDGACRDSPVASGREREILRDAPSPGHAGQPPEGIDLPAAGHVSGDEADDGVEPDQYFTERPRSASSRSELRFLYRGEMLHFLVDRGVFASHGLDPGTALLIQNLTLDRADRVLDLGCGWGPVGIAAARSVPDGSVVLTEVNRRAVRLARLNLGRNRVKNAEDTGGTALRTGGRRDVQRDRDQPAVPRGPGGCPRDPRGSPRAPDTGRTARPGREGNPGDPVLPGMARGNWPGTVEVLGRGSGDRVLEARRDPKSRHA